MNNVQSNINTSIIHKVPLGFGLGSEGDLTNVRGIKGVDQIDSWQTDFIVMLRDHSFNLFMFGLMLTLKTYLSH